MCVKLHVLALSNAWMIFVSRAVCHMLHTLHTHMHTQHTRVKVPCVVV